MRSSLAAIVIGMSVAAGQGAEPSLPGWEEGELAELEAAGWQAGALLLTDDPIPGDPEPSWGEPLSMEPPPSDEITEDSAVVSEIPEVFLADYFAARPGSFLVDPQVLLGAADHRDRLAFLNYHAGDSSIDLFVYLIGGDQEIPSDVRDEELLERWFNEGRPAAVVHYYLGNPKRSTLQLSFSLADAISPAERHRALESSVMTALEKTNPSEQLDKFLVQMSIRLYWMERLIADPAKAVEEAPNPAVVAVVAEAKPDRLEKIRGLVMPYAKPGGAALAGFVMVFGWIVILKKRARYRFPEFDVEPRLGGAHAAGVGAVISFANASVPPASQRDQIPEYLRRA